MTTAAEPIRLSPPQRALSLAEFLVGAAVVIGHNVFHVVPNEVPILFVLAIVSIRLREGSFGAIGLSRPKSWLLTILFAVIAAAIVIAMGEYVTDPLAIKLGLHSTDKAASALGTVKGDVWTALKGLALVWTFAAFGEEISYRRYLLGRAADLGDRTPLAHWIALVVVSVLFGIGHWYQGPAGSLHDCLRRLRHRRRVSLERSQSLGGCAHAWVGRYGRNCIAVLRPERLSIGTLARPPRSPAQCSAL